MLRVSFKMLQACQENLMIAQIKDFVSANKMKTSSNRKKGNVRRHKLPKRIEMSPF